MDKSITKRIGSGIIIGVILGILVGVAMYWLIKAAGQAFALEYAFASGLILCLMWEGLMLMEFLDLRSRAKKTALSFQEAFSRPFPPAEGRASVQSVVVERLVDNRRLVDVAREERDSIARKWLESSLQSAGGVAQRLALQREYDKIGKDLQRAEEQFEKACDAAREAGFREEVRAFGYPKVTVRSSAQDVTAITVASAVAVVAMS